jgi:hypothetical protein
VTFFVNKLTFFVSGQWAAQGSLRSFAAGKMEVADIVTQNRQPGFWSVGKKKGVRWHGTCS